MATPEQRQRLVNLANAIAEIHQGDLNNVIDWESHVTLLHEAAKQNARGKRGDVNLGVFAYRVKTGADLAHVLEMILNWVHTFIEVECEFGVWEEAGKLYQPQEGSIALKNDPDRWQGRQSMQLINKSSAQKPEQPDKPEE
jgi:hypothetical protein